MFLPSLHLLWPLFWPPKQLPNLCTVSFILSKSPSLPDVFDSSSKENEARDSTLALYKGDTKPPTPKGSVKLGWKLKALLGAAIVANGAFDWALVDHLMNSNKKQYSPPPSSPSSATPPSNPPQQNYGFPTSGVSCLTHGTQQTTDLLTIATQQSSEDQTTSPNQQR